MGMPLSATVEVYRNTSKDANLCLQMGGEEGFPDERMLERSLRRTRKHGNQDKYERLRHPGTLAWCLTVGWVCPGARKQGWGGP